MTKSHTLTTDRCFLFQNYGNPIAHYPRPEHKFQCDVHVCLKKIIRAALQTGREAILSKSHKMLSKIGLQGTCTKNGSTKEIDKAVPFYGRDITFILANHSILKFF